jgi:hypothetical protein
MRRPLVAIVDAAVTAALGFAGFWLGYHLTPCRDVSSCAPLAPITVIAVIVFVAAYFVGGHLFFRSTPAERLFGARNPREDRRD